MNTHRKFPSVPASLKRWFLGLSIALLLGLGFDGVVFHQSIARLWHPAQASGLSGSGSVSEVVMTPTPRACEENMLSIGEVKFPIQPVNSVQEIPASLPPGITDNAYWLEGTKSNYVFIIKFTDSDQSQLNSLLTEINASVTWSNCENTIYNLGQAMPGDPTDSTLLDQSIPMATIFIPNATGSGWSVLQGYEEQTLGNPETASIQAEITILKTTTSSDKSTITVSISINNYGKTLVKLTGDDVLLLPDDNSPSIVPVKTRPVLPLVIKPGKTKSIDITFPRPSSATATLSILSVYLPLENY